MPHGLKNLANSDFAILTVCTGNICRSPAMERLLAFAVQDDPEIGVHSAGIYAHDGEDMQPPMKKRVAAYGADVSHFVARQLSGRMIHDADFVLTATRDHVHDILTDTPEAEDKIFTVRECGRIISGVGEVEFQDEVDAQMANSESSGAVERWQAIVKLLHAHRFELTPVEELDDVVDPYYLPESVYDDSFAQLRKPIEAMVRIQNGVAVADPEEL